MRIRPPTGSRFRPARAIDQSLSGREQGAHRTHRSPQGPARRAQPGRADVAGRLRRDRTDAMQKVLTAVSAWNDRAQALLFDQNNLAPTFTEAEVLRPPRFNAYYSRPTSPRSTLAELEARARRPDLRQAAVDRARYLRACRSRRSSSGTSASKAGTISANGRGRICGAFSNPSAPT